MIVILGLIILIIALITAVAGVLSNSGGAHALAHDFSVFGYHVTGSSGVVFLSGIVVGAAALLGLGLLLTGARRSARRGRTARSGLKQSRRETAAVNRDRDALLEQRETTRAQAARDQAEPTPGHDEPREPRPFEHNDGQNRPHVFGRRSSR